MPIKFLNFDLFKKERLVDYSYPYRPKASVPDRNPKGPLLRSPNPGLEQSVWVSVAILMICASLFVMILAESGATQ